VAEATDDPKVTYERLAWAADWHVREETYQKAIAEVVNAHYRLPFSQNWGVGTTSSSDGQVFFAGGPKDALSQPNAKYGRDRGVAFYTHLSDQYAPFYSRVINTTVRDATYVLDGLLYHESDLDIAEHHSDTEGFTDQVFGATHVLGYRFAPRIRNMKKTKVFTIRKPSRYPDLAPIVGGKVNVRDISSNWDEVLRLMASIKTGTVTASLILKKLANYPRQNGLAKALREIGKIERSLFGLDWYQDLELRRRVNAGLNKGEVRNALARRLLQPPGRASRPLLRGPAGPRQRPDPTDSRHRAVERRLPGEGRGCAADTGRGSSRRIPAAPLAARMGAHHPHGRLPMEPRRRAPSARQAAAPAKALADDRLKKVSAELIRVPEEGRLVPTVQFTRIHAFLPPSENRILNSCVNKMRKGQGLVPQPKSWSATSRRRAPL
jgi:TnpA family transposase